MDQQSEADSYLAIFMIRAVSFLWSAFVLLACTKFSSVSYLSKDGLGVQIGDKTFRYYGLRSRVFTGIFFELAAYFYGSFLLATIIAPQYTRLPTIP